MGDADRQLDFWGTLDGTRVVATTAGTSLMPWQAPTKADVARAFGDADAQNKGRSGARPLDAKVPADWNAGSGTPYAQAGGAKSKGTAIRPARYGNALVIRRRD